MSVSRLGNLIGNILAAGAVTQSADAAGVIVPSMVPSDYRVNADYSNIGALTNYNAVNQIGLYIQPNGSVKLQDGTYVGSGYKLWFLDDGTKPTEWDPSAAFLPGKQVVGFINKDYETGNYNFSNIGSSYGIRGDIEETTKSLDEGATVNTRLQIIAEKCGEGVFYEASFANGRLTNGFLLGKAGRNDIVINTDSLIWKPPEQLPDTGLRMSSDGTNIEVRYVPGTLESSTDLLSWQAVTGAPSRIVQGAVGDSVYVFKTPLKTAPACNIVCVPGKYTLFEGDGGPDGPWVEKAQTNTIDGFDIKINYPGLIFRAAMVSPNTLEIDPWDGSQWLSDPLHRLIVEGQHLTPVVAGKSYKIEATPNSFNFQKQDGTVIVSNVPESDLSLYDPLLRTSVAEFFRVVPEAQQSSTNSPSNDSPFAPAVDASAKNPYTFRKK